MQDRTRPVIAIWANTDGPDPACVFTADEYADFAESNSLHGSYSQPNHFYGINPDGTLTELIHTAESSPYDEDDYATVTHTWSTTSKPATVYATGCARSDGRA